MIKKLYRNIKGKFGKFYLDSMQSLHNRNIISVKMKTFDRDLHCPFFQGN